MVGSFLWAAGSTARQVDSGRNLTITARIRHIGADRPAPDRGWRPPTRPPTLPEAGTTSAGAPARAKPPARRSTRRSACSLMRQAAVNGPDVPLPLCATGVPPETGRTRAQDELQESEGGPDLVGKGDPGGSHWPNADFGRPARRAWLSCRMSWLPGGLGSGAHARPLLLSTRKQERRAGRRSGTDGARCGS